MATDKLLPYVPSGFPAIQGEEANARYTATELRKISQSIAQTNAVFNGMFPLALTNIAGIATGTFLGNISGVDASPAALTATQVTANLDVFVGDTGSGGTKGLVPAPAAGMAAAFLRGDATWTLIDFTIYSQKANNLSDLTNTATARTNLGVAIGTDVLAYDAQLTSNVRQNQQDANYTLVLADGEKHLWHTSASAHTWTIPANASVAFPIGTCITFANGGTGAVTIAIATDTLFWSPSGTTGSRTLGQYGLATAIKLSSTGWFISGTGLS